MHVPEEARLAGEIREFIDHLLVLLRKLGWHFHPLFRDDAFQKFYNSPSYQSHVLTKFGPKAVVEIQEMTKIPLKRGLLGD